MANVRRTRCTCKLEPISNIGYALRMTRIQESGRGEQERKGNERSIPGAHQRPHSHRSFPSGHSHTTHPIRTSLSPIRLATATLRCMHGVALMACSDLGRLSFRSSALSRAHLRAHPTPQGWHRNPGSGLELTATVGAQGVSVERSLGNVDGLEGDPARGGQYSGFAFTRRGRR